MTLLLGFNTVGTDGNDFEAGNNGPMIASKYVAAATGTVDTITLRTNSANACNSVSAAIFSDSAGTPNAKIGNVVTIALATGVTSWQTSPSGVAAPVTSGTTYWIVLWSKTASNITFSLHDSSTAAGTKDTPGETSLLTPWPSTVGSFTELMNAHADDAGAAAGPSFVPSRMPLGL